MSLFLILAGCGGALVAIINMVGGALYIDRQLLVKREASVMPGTVWRHCTMPALSCVSLFVLQHWIFSIGVFLSGLRLLLSPWIFPNFPWLSFSWKLAYFELLPGVAGRVVLVFGTAAVLAPSILSWQFPVIVAGAFIATLIANVMMQSVIGILAGARFKG